MSAIAPQDYDEPTPRTERARGERNVSAPDRPSGNPMMRRFAFMWDGWRSIEVDDNFVLA
jgi:hypothetical protein